MIVRFARASLVVSVAVVAMLAGCKKRGPMQVLASCDLREGAGADESMICMDVGDKGFLPKAKSICTHDDEEMSDRWKANTPCDRTGSLGGCKSTGGIMWYYASTKHKTADDVKKECKSSSDTYVAVTDELAPGASATPVASGKGGTPSTGTPAAGPLPAGAPDLAALLGTKGDGWVPKFLASLKKDMTRAQVAKLYPGADKVDSSEVAEVKPKDVKGVTLYRFHYNENKLFKVDVYFDSSLHTPAFRAAMLKAGTAKWGAPHEDSPDRIDWQSPDIDSIDFDDTFETPKSYQLEVELPST